MISLMDCFAIIRWLLVLLALQVSAYVLLKPRIPQYAFVLSFTTGLLSYCLITWYTGLIGIYPVYSFLLVILALSYGVLDHRESFRGIRAYWKYYALFFLAFLAFLILKVHFNSDIVFIHYGESWMDTAFTTQIMRNPIVPPNDPWFAGYSLDFYYYLCYWLYGMLGLTAAVPSSVLFNLMLPTIAAVTVVNLYALGEAAVPRLKMLPAIFVFALSPGFFYFLFNGQIPISNLLRGSTIFTYSTLFQVLHSSARPLAFSMCVQTYMILLLAIAFSEWRGADKNMKMALTVLISLGLASMIPICSWLALVWWPAFFAFGLFLAYRQKIPGAAMGTENGPLHSQTARPLSWSTLGTAIVFIVPVILLGSLLYLPFILQMNNHSIQGIRLIGEQFDITSFFLAYGWFLIGLLISLRNEFRRYWPAALVIVPFYIVGHTVAGVSLFLLTLLAARRKDAFDLFAGSGLVAIIFCSFFSFVEITGSNNTLMKLVFAVWLLFGVSSSVMAGREIDRLIKAPGKLLGPALDIAPALLLAGIIILPGIFLVGTPKDYSPTLDGSLWLNASHPADAGAISFLNSLGGDHILVEANGTALTYNSRVSTFTGIPTILGWESHEWQWRTDNPAGWVEERTGDIKSIYEDPDSTVRLMRKYGADLLYVGPTEQEQFAVDLPESGLRPIYRNGGVTIYAVE